MNEDKIVDIFIILGAIAIIVLKITNIITISWLWLLSPLWILMGLGIVLCILITIMYIIHDITYKGEKKNERY